MSDLVRFSKLIRHYRRTLRAVIGKRRLQKMGANNSGNVNQRKIFIS